MQQQNGWTAAETKELFDLVAKITKEGKGLRVAFDQIAQKTNRKPNSVRNYYYAQAKAFSLIPNISKTLGIKEFSVPKKADFVPFSKAEVDELVSYILIEQAKGRSVRAITTELAHGDTTVMLRLQNKYRSMAFSRRGYLDKLMAKMREKKLTFFNPITKRMVVDGVETVGQGKGILENMRIISGSLNEQEISPLLNGLAMLVERAAAAKLDDAGEAKNSVLALENSKLKSEIQALKGELAALKKQRQTNAVVRVAEQAQTNSKLKQINQFFLAKTDKDKIKSLGEYVSDLGKILSETN